MNKLKYILPLLLTMITIVIYKPIETQASITNYSIQYFDGSFWANDGTIGSFADHHRTNKIEIINNSIILSQQTFGISFWNNNTFLGTYNQPAFYTPYLGTFNSIFNNGSIIIPNNATHFALIGFNGSYSGSISTTFAQFQTVTVTYDNPTPQPLEVNTPDVYNIDTYVAAFTTDNLFLVSQENAPFVDSYGFEIYSDAGSTLFRDKDMTGLQSSDEGNLTPNTTYWYKGYVEMTDSNRYYGTLKSFSTLQITQPSVPAPTYEMDFNLALTYTLPEVNPGTETNIAERGLLVTTDGTAPTIQNFAEQYTVPNSNIRYLYPNADYGKTYRVVQYMKGTNNAYYYSQELTFITPGEIFTVNFYDYDDTLIDSVQAEEGTAAQAPANPTRIGYTFIGWEPPISDIQGNLNTYAQYTLNSYIVTFIDSGVIIQEALRDHFTELGTFAPPVQTRQGFTLNGWYESDDETETPIDFNNYVVTKPVELVAIWEEVITFTVTWRDPSFNTLKIETVDSGLTGTPPSSYASGLTASGFQLDGWAPDPNVPVTANISYIAQVSPIPIDELITQSGTTIIYRTQLPDDYSGITDLFGGVFGGIVGTIMILGTIDLFGVQLASLLWLFFAGTGFFMMWKLVK
jgi:hypothetical protein